MCNTRAETSAELSLIFKTNGFWKDLPAVEAFFTFFLQCRIADAFTKYFFFFLGFEKWAIVQSSKSHGKESFGKFRH